MGGYVKPRHCRAMHRHIPCSTLPRYSAHASTSADAVHHAWRILEATWASSNHHRHRRHCRTSVGESHGKRCRGDFVLRHRRDMQGPRARAREKQLPPRPPPPRCPGPPSPLRPPPLSSSHLLLTSSAAASLFRAASLPHCPSCPGRQRQTAHAAADCSTARDCQGNHSQQEQRRQTLQAQGSADAWHCHGGSWSRDAKP